MFATSADGTQIYYEVTGEGDTALVCVHGWLGNVRWWDATRDAFASTHRVVALDLAGHGKSSRRAVPTAEGYGADILAVVRAVGAARVVLAGHSMSGGYATLVAPEIANLATLVLVDTLKNLDALPPAAQMDAMFAMYRADFKTAVETMLPKFLFAPDSPPAVVERVIAEFSTSTGEVAAALLEPLYRVDLQAAARKVTVPTRGIGSLLPPNSVEANRQYFRDYTYRALAGCGHYPMLEVPDAFVAALREELR